MKHLNIFELKESDKGRLVNYIPYEGGPRELGKLVRWDIDNKCYVFVDYNGQVKATPYWRLEFVDIETK